ncbi:inositol-tetrakisphosphate 1-kinase-like isoform X2 [Varroa destructor]|uniref:Inositol-tetrakisphosphate 1-kinase n=1 Tax=Varroa destructor TaxID=109461 RepID=A0A7M7M9N9_VARDE|nr:inositol-tetrakisphosphate 1-kinase-like isoform X2 [Varroa destructor]
MDQTDGSQGPMQRVGYWWPDKKEKYVSPKVLRKHLREYNLELVKELSSSNPRMVILDPLSSVRAILDRNNQYQTVKSALDQLEENISVPPFVRLDAAEPDVNIHRVQESGLKFPLVCKPIVAQGTEAHIMQLIFNECGLRKLNSFPCIVQQFVPHGSVLYKVFVVGPTFSVIKRPSFKNITTSSKEDLIEFHSHDISKPDASSPLIDREAWHRPDKRGDSVGFSGRLARAVEAVRQSTKQTLCGIDVIVEEQTGRLYVIDVNNFPGYSGMENFMSEFIRLITASAARAANSPPARATEVSSATPTNGLGADI